MTSFLRCGFYREKSVCFEVRVWFWNASGELGIYIRSGLDIMGSAGNMGETMEMDEGASPSELDGAGLRKRTQCSRVQRQS